MAKILYLTGMQPARMANGTEIATRMIASTLTELGHEVVTIGYSRPDDTVSDPAAIVIDRRTIEFSEASARQKAIWAIESIIRHEPLSVSKYRRPAAANLLVNELEKGVDCVLVDKPQMVAVFHREVSGHPFSVVWHAIEHQTYAAVARDSRGLQRYVYRREAHLAKIMEASLLGHVNHVFTLTSADAQALNLLGYRGPIDVTPMIVPVTTGQQLAASAEVECDVGLLGNWTWAANASGLEWFLRKVRPALPSNMSVALGGRGGDGVAPEITNVTRAGFVDDARIFLGKCRVVAIPLKAGTGVSMKVLEAACAGWPTVTTTIGARGIGDLPANVMIADDPADFAYALKTMSSSDTAQRSAWALAGNTWMQNRRIAFGGALASGVQHLLAAKLSSTGA